MKKEISALLNEQITKEFYSILVDHGEGPREYGRNPTRSARRVLPGKEAIAVPGIHKGFMK